LSSKNVPASTSPPLSGRTFLVTRTMFGNMAEKKKLESFGAKVIDLPLIEIHPPTESGPISDCINRIGEFDWIVFTSANGVNAFFKMLEREDGKRQEIRAKFACIGSETQRALKEHGFAPSLVPREFLTRTLGEEMLANFSLEEKQVLLARAEDANKDLAGALREGGVAVEDAPVYKTAQKRIENLPANFLERITDVTLTSPSTVYAFAINFRVQEITERRIKVHCIGPVTAEAAKKVGLRVSTTAEVHTIDGLIDSIIDEAR
jgi:uroporphyrinogen III methyltransferase/synthase